MKFQIPVFLIAVLLSFWNPGGAQGSHGFESHATEPRPRPPQEYSSESGSYRFSSRDVITAFRKSGLEAADTKPGLTVGAPGARDSIIFLVPSFGKGIGGLISSFRSAQDLRKAVQHYEMMSTGTAVPPWRIFTRGNILLLISGKIPLKTAEAYKHVLTVME